MNTDLFFFKSSIYITQTFLHKNMYFVGLLTFLYARESPVSIYKKKTRGKNMSLFQLFFYWFYQFQLGSTVTRYKSIAIYKAGIALFSKA